MDVRIKDKRRVVSLYIHLETLSNSEYYAVNGIQVVYEIIKKDFENSLPKLAKLKRQNPLLSPKLLREMEITGDDRHHVLNLTTKSPVFITPQDPYKIDGETLLHKALIIQDTGIEERDKVLADIIDMLIKHCPDMIALERKDKNDNYTGITPIHLAILKQDNDLLDLMLSKAKAHGDVKRVPNVKQKEEDTLQPIKQSTNDIETKNDAKEQSLKLEASVTGKCCKNSIMVAGFPLAVAALTLNTTIFSTVLKSSYNEINSRANLAGDNLIHSLIRQAARCPEKVNGTLEMLDYLIPNKETGKRNTKKSAEIKQRDRQLLLMMVNREKLTPLLLAAKLKQHEIFKFIMSSEVYRSTDTSGCMTEEEKYDITEIDTIGVEQTQKSTLQNVNIKNKKHICILEHLINQEPLVAFNIADVVAVREVIRFKWNTYYKYFYLWFFIHVCFMSLITICGIRRSYIFESAYENGTSDEPGIPNFKIKMKESALYKSGISLGLVFGVVHLAMEAVRMLFFRRFPSYTRKQNQKLISPRSYSDVTFRILFLLFAVLLIADFAASFNQSYEHYCLIFAIIIGWYNTLFFLKTLEPFSFFAILIERALIELVKFAIVMGVLLVAFSAAMFMAMQGAKNMDNEESFRHFKFTVLKMFMIMVGLGDLGVLFNARHPIISVTIFIMFVLLTTILLLNAFLALMSEICAELVNIRNNISFIKIHTRLHKLSAILFIEGILPIRLCKEVGKIKNVCRFDTETNSWTASVPRRYLTTTEITEKVSKFTNEGSRSVSSTLTKADTEKSALRKGRKITNKVANAFRSASGKTVQNGKSVKLLEVKDIEKQKCGNCGEEAVTHTQTQEITENSNVPEQERNKQIEIDERSVDI